MKKTLQGFLFCAATVLCGMEMIPQEQYSKHIVTPRPGYVSKHLDWGKEIPDHQELHVLFLVPSAGFRDVQELGQRQKMHITVYGAKTERQFVRIPELIQKLVGKYDVIVLGNIHFTSLPGEAQYRILNAVEKGTGLVVVGKQPRIPYRKVLEKPLRGISFPAVFMVPSSEKDFPAGSCFQAWQLGKGIIAELRYDIESSWGYYSGNSLLPVSIPNRQSEALQENAMGLLLRTIRFAADAKDSFWNAVQEGDQLRIANLPDQANVSLRFRDTENNILKSEVLLPGEQTCSLRELPRGEIFCDVTVTSRDSAPDFGIFTLKLPPPFGKMRVETQEEIRGNTPVRATVKWEKPLDSDMFLRIHVLDSPEYRTWIRKDFPVGKGMREVSFELKHDSIPSIIAFLRCELLRPNGNIVAKTEKELYFPGRKLGKYYQYAWGGATSLNMARQMNDLVGWRGALAHPTEIKNHSYSYFNQQLISYIVRVLLQKDTNGAVKQAWGPFINSALMPKLKALNGDHNFYRPEVQDFWRDVIEFRFNAAKKLDTALYSLGDENGFSYEAGFGPSDLHSFREFCEKKYKTIAKYNSVHGTMFASFSEIPHQTLKEAKEKGAFAAWFDHREYMEHMYADLHNFLREEIRKRHPHALVGAEGSEPGNFELSIRSMDFWGPYNDIMISEALRSFAPAKVRSLWWGGYAYASPYPVQADYLVLGTANASAWFLAVSSNTVASAFGSDCLPVASLQKYLPLLDRFRFGLADLLISKPMPSPEILLHWSHPSQAASLLDSRCPVPRDGITTLIPFFYKHALAFDFVSERTLDRLKHPSVKVLFLCGSSAIGEKEAEAVRAFVKRGGTVIADRNPGILNEYLQILPQTTLSALFGTNSFHSVPAPSMKDHFHAEGTGGNRLEAAKALVTPNRSYWKKSRYGKGNAILANFNFAVVAASSNGNGSFDNFLQKELKSIGVQFPAELEGGSKNPVIRFRRAEDHRIAAVSVPLCDTEKKLSLILPEKAHLYDILTGKYVYGKCFTWQDPSYAIRLIGIFAAKQNAPAITLPQKILKKGDALLCNLSGNPSGRVISLRFFDPSGKELKDRCLISDENRTVPFQSSYSDPAGNYKILVTDQSTGLTSEYDFTLQ